jgi:crossover junction endonuclease EME1
MAPDVIDLVSSSPPRSGVDAPPPPAPSASVPAKRTASTLVSKAVNIEVLSDDFARSDDFDEILTSNNGRENQTQGTKRQRRLSVESRQHSRPSQVSRETQDISTLPPLKRATAAQAGFSVIDDPIEFTSSIEANQIGSQKASTAASNSRPAAPNRASSVTDPFASSPSAATTKPKPSAVVNNHHDLSSDPFASSSPVKTRVTKPCTPSQKAGQGRQQSRNPVAAWDPIPSSAPFSPTVPRTEILQRSASCAAVITIDESSESSSEDDDLPAIEDFDLSQPTKYSIPYANGTSSKQKAKSKSRNPTSKHTQEERSRQRVEKTAAKEAEKARRRREKELEKQERQKQRDIAAAIAEVNKARADKKVSTREMIVLLPTTLDPSLMVQLQTLLDGLDVQHSTQQSELNNLITWNRKINSRFDDDAGQWVPMPQRIEPEKHVLKVMTAEELVELATSEKLDQHIQAIKRHYPSEQIILLLQGITAWTRKNRNIRNRQFASGVRSQADSASTTARRRNDDPQQEYISEDVVEDALLRLQITHETLIHHTAVPLETAQWITTFTQHISTIPYKRQREEATSTARFCMESGQVKTGDDTQDTYVRMLQEIFRITAPIAYGVAAEYNSVTKLIEGLEKGGPNTLTGVHKSANRDGASSDRTIGQAVSRRLYKVFTGRDETSTDV